MLHRYWITFRRFPRPTSLNLGCGVTAESSDAALALVRERIFANGEDFEVAAVIEDVDVRALDANHVRPNMGVVTWRGIWFPRGYAESDEPRRHGPPPATA